MLRKLQKNDYIFFAVIFVCFLLHFLCIFTPLPYNDEFLYPAAPFRFINGDSMIQHEWHLSQFSSLFSYIPVMIWLKLKGSAEGLLLFLRFLYLFFHTLVAAIIYKSFRKYKLWAIATAILFYTQVPYRMLTISYMSVLMIFLLVFELSVFLILDKAYLKLYVLAYLKVKMSLLQSVREQTGYFGDLMNCCI